jgi:hypothetical protein
MDIWCYKAHFCVFQLEPDNEMDKIIKYILDRDIKIRALDAKYNNVSLERSQLKLQGKGPLTQITMALRRMECYNSAKYNSEKCRSA